MNGNKINFAVIGCGYIGRRHIEIISGHPLAKLVAVCDVNGRGEQLVVSGVREGRFFDSAEKMLTSTVPIDVVCIATPNGLHAKHALLALDAGKHVVIEKPIALSTKDADAILSKAAEMKKQVFCILQNRFSRQAIWLKDILESRRLGDIFIVQINCFWNRDDRYYKKGDWRGTMQLDGGTLFTQFAHFVDSLYWLFGDIKNIHAIFQDFTHGHSTEFEDSGIVTFDFLKGGMGSINYSTSVWDKNFESNISVIAEKGSLKIGGQQMDKIEYCHIKDYEFPAVELNNNNDSENNIRKTENHRYFFDHVIDVLKNGETSEPTAISARKITELIEIIYEKRTLSSRKI